MVKTSRKASAERSFPTKEDVLDFVREAHGPVGKREIARAFSVRSSDKSRLKELILDMEEEGVLERRRRRVTRHEALPPVLAADIRERDSDGEFIAFPVEWNAELGSPPRIVVRSERSARGRSTPPGIGSRVLIKLDNDAEPPADNTFSGRVIKVLAEKKAPMLGLFRANPAGGGFYVPVEKRERGRELPIMPGDENGARDGDLVSASLIRAGRFGAPYARVRERLGSVKSEKSVSLIAVHTHDIPLEFPQSVAAEAESVRKAVMKGRDDWRDVPFVTIDPPDAKDHDDAVFAVPDDAPDNPGGFILKVAIADVAWYVRPGSALDREALRRGNSTYFPDRVVPMLPERISNDLCSLVPGVDRPAVAARLVVGVDGRVRGSAFFRVMIRSRARLYYEQVQAAVDGKPDDTTASLVEAVLKPLFDAYRCVARARDARSPLGLDLPERKILLNSEGHVDRVIVPPHLEAHRVIEEFMILANVAAAELLENSRLPLVYRVHDSPSPEKMRSINEVLASIGLKIPKQGALRSRLFNGILAAVKGSRHEMLIHEMVLRSQAQAEYSPDNIGHFGLNLRRYTHFTSPIRRYADVMVHRGILRALNAGEGALSGDLTHLEITEISSLISAAERRSMAAERETVDRLVAHYLSERVGASFEGGVTGVTKSGLFVRLNGTGADGFIPVGSLGHEYFRFDEGRMALVGDESDVAWRLGDPVRVCLVEAVPAAGLLRFELLDDAPASSTGTRRRVARSGRRSGEGTRSRRRITGPLKEIDVVDSGGD
ncbi:MAG: ribonuclease R [Methylobacteriaceae bacterium]|nr:ribonuclease R [Methylobacteriaceae bacterium]